MVCLLKNIRQFLARRRFSFKINYLKRKKGVFQIGVKFIEFNKFEYRVAVFVDEVN